MEYLSEWLTLVFVFGLAVMAPGPDFVMAIRNSLVYSRRAGFYTALGFALGVCVHVLYTIIGLGAIISKSVILFSIIKLIGAGYLFYIGFNAIMSRKKSKLFDKISQDHETLHMKQTMSACQAIRSGFITNLFNPKATLFFLALFTQILRPEVPYNVQGFFGLTCVALVWGWFSFVAFVLTHKKVRDVFLKFSGWIDRLCGGLMIALGAKLALSR